MTERDDRLQSLLQRLETERDELKMKLGLAKLEAREEWQELEDKIQGLRGRLKLLRDEAGEASGDLGTAFDMMADEVKQGLERMKKLL